MYVYSCDPNQWYTPMQGYRNVNWSYAWYPSYYYWNARTDDSYESITLQDYGTKPLVINLAQAAIQNPNYRTALWTGEHFQVTLMSIQVGEDIGLEVHPATDQLIRIEDGQGLVQIGDSKDQMMVQTAANEGDAILIPAGKWHNVTNTGNRPLKLSVVYAPPQHPYGTVQETKAIAEQEGR